MPTGYDYEQHVVSVRIRLQGSGTFHGRLAGLEDNPEQDLAETTMSATANRPVSLLSNIRSMRVQFHGYIEDELNEYFVIKNITFYTKPITTGYPQ